MFAADFGYQPNRDYSASSSLVPAFTMVPQYKQKGRVEQGLFGPDELEQRITDDFLTEMAKESREEREKREAEIRKQEEAAKRMFLKDKWQKIIDSMSKNYKHVDLSMFEAQNSVSDWTKTVDPRVAAEIKRCMAIPSVFLRTKLVRDCDQCAKGLYNEQEHYKPIRDPHDPNLDFDGHFPEDHVNLDGFETRTKEERDEYLNSLASHPPSFLYGGGRWWTGWIDGESKILRDNFSENLYT